jgi:hypothetical protein
VPQPCNHPLGLSINSPHGSQILTKSSTLLAQEILLLLVCSIRFSRTKRTGHCLRSSHFQANSLAGKLFRKDSKVSGIWCKIASDARLSLGQNSNPIFVQIKLLQTRNSFCPPVVNFAKLPFVAYLEPIHPASQYFFLSWLILCH